MMYAVCLLFRRDSFFFWRKATSGHDARRHDIENEPGDKTRRRDPTDGVTDGAKVNFEDEDEEC